MKQENNDDQADDDRFLHEVALERFDGGMNQPRAIVTGDDLDSRRQRRLDLGKLLLDSVDHVERIQAVPHHYNASDRFPLAIPLGHAFADVRSERHCP